MPRPDEAAPALIYKDGEDIVLDGETYDDPLVAVRSKTVTLTDAQIKSATAGDGRVEIVPGQAGKAIFCLGGFAIADTTSGVYTNIDITDNSVMLKTGTFGSASIPLYNDLGSLLGDSIGNGQVTVVMFSPPSNRSTTITTNIVPLPTDIQYWDGEGLDIELYNGTGALTGGHADNTLKITALYTFIDVP